MSRPGLSTDEMPSTVQAVEDLGGAAVAVSQQSSGAPHRRGDRRAVRWPVHPVAVAAVDQELQASQVVAKVPGIRDAVAIAAGSIDRWPAEDDNQFRDGGCI